MEGTIEERAARYADVQVDYIGYDLPRWGWSYASYCQGAHDQKEIDDAELQKRIDSGELIERSSVWHLPIVDDKEEHTTKGNVESKCGKPEDNVVSSYHYYLRGAADEREIQEAIRGYLRDAITNELIDKACEWGREHIIGFTEEAFREAMMEEQI